jgi:hypothetical protein
MWMAIVQLDAPAQPPVAVAGAGGHSSSTPLPLAFPVFTQLSAVCSLLDLVPAHLVSLGLFAGC